jgi:hypothetical protein
MTRNAKPLPERVHVAKPRRCLMCEEAFESRWAGERVCRRCKDRDGWRNGTSLPPDYEAGRRR